ncbi:MAG: hypothetical protein F082_1323 [bacterium F082]|nr:MAG: hypothetical protein F082_1323 [bacterium F082]
MLKLKSPVAKLKENERTMAAAKKAPKGSCKKRQPRKGGCK